MNLNITGHHVEVTPALREFVTSKVDRVLRHVDHVTSAHVVLTVEKLNQKADITVHLKGKDIFADATDTDLYAAIDKLIDKLGRLVEKYRGKQNDHGHERPNAE